MRCDLKAGSGSSLKLTIWWIVRQPALLLWFRGKLCDLIRPNRKATTFNKHQVIYDMGDGERTLFFLQNGVVEMGTISANGREVIYDVRKGGDVVVWVLL
jgi:CRP-like cAMP-binding protein